MSLTDFIAPQMGEPKQDEPTADTPVELFPVSFTVIAAREDMEEHIPRLLATLPRNSEVCILTNSEGAAESLSEVMSEVADGFTIRTRHWTYCKHFHFANARNMAADMATNDWVFWLDCDDRLAACQHETIHRAVTEMAAHLGYGAIFAACTSMHVPIPPNTIGDYSVVKQCRMYRRSTGARWTGRVHEQIWCHIQMAGFAVAPSVLNVMHVGYSTDVEKIKQKNRRNVALMIIGLAEQDNPMYGENGAYKLEILTRDLNSLAALERTK